MLRTLGDFITVRDTETYEFGFYREETPNAWSKTGKHVEWVTAKRCKGRFSLLPMMTSKTRKRAIAWAISFYVKANRTARKATP